MTDAAIIVPSYNRPDQLRGCLESLVVQDAPDFSIVVVDDGSPTPLAPVCAVFGDRVTCIRQDNAGPASARNRGAASTTARFLTFTDDDCRPRPDWLRRLVDAHAGAPNRLVGGHVVNGLPDDIYAATSQALCDYLYDRFDAEGGQMPFFTSNNIGCARDAFDKLGGFDETFPLAAAEDRDFGLRWRESGGDLAFVGSAVVDHYHQMTFRKFWRQHRNYGAGARHLHKVMEERGSDLPRREPLSFYLDLVVWPVRAEGLRGVPKLPLMALTQMAMIRGYAAAKGSAI